MLLDRNYITVSTPNCVDIWLGFMIDDALWYLLWEPNQIHVTTTTILSVIKSCDIFYSIFTFI